MGKKLWTMWMSILLTLVFFRVSFADEINYQKVVDNRGDNIVISTYGTKEVNYFSCSVSNLNCVDKGLKSPQIFPEFVGKEYFLSSDKSIGLVEQQNSSLAGDFPPTYILYKLNGDNFIIDKTLNFSDETKAVKISGDNKKALFLTNDGDYVVFDLEKNNEVARFKKQDGGSFLTFSNYGNYFAYYKPNTLDDSIRTYYLVDVLKNKQYFWNEENQYWDLISEEDRAFDFSNDESQFNYLSGRGGYLTLYKVDLKKLNSLNLNNGAVIGKKIFSSNFTVGSFIYGLDNKLYFVANRENPVKWNLYSYDLKTEIVKKINDNVSYWPALKNISNSLAFYKLNQTPSVVALFDYNNKEIKNFSGITKDSQPIKLGEVKKFTKAWGVVYKPDNYKKNKKYPMIVWLHGGPYRQVGLSYHPYLSYGAYDLLLEKLRQDGFLVLKIDYRGSYGYGVNFAKQISKNVGKLDVYDVVDAVNKTKKEFKLGDVYVMGNSYGGYLSLKTVADYPKLFKGTISINGVSDWWTLLEDIPSSIFKTQFGGIPSNKNKKLYDKASIFLKTNQLAKKKVMLVYGQKDLTVPVKQTQMIYEELGAINIDNIKLMTIPDEGHVIEKDQNLENLYNQLKDFLGKK